MKVFEFEEKYDNTVEPGYSEPGCSENLAVLKRPDGLFLLHTCILPWL